MELTRQAFSQDGFLIAQEETAAAPFGRYPSSRNGCGWIAAYNFLRADLHPVQWDQVRRDLQRALPFRGRIGANAWVLRGYLRRHGCRLHSAATKGGACHLAENCRAGIILYWTGKHNHYVAFQRRRDGSLRFFNAAPGQGDCVMTMEEFFRRFVKFPAVMVFATKG